MSRCAIASSRHVRRNRWAPRPTLILGIVAATIASGCTGSSAEPEPEEPVSSTIAVGEPTVTVGSNRTDTTGPRVVLSELAADEVIVDSQGADGAEGAVGPLSDQRIDGLIARGEEAFIDPNDSGGDTFATPGDASGAVDWPPLAATIGRRPDAPLGAAVPAGSADDGTRDTTGDPVADNSPNESPDEAVGDVAADDAAGADTGDDDGTSRIVGVAPVGDVDVAQFINISFSQPMIPPDLIGSDANVPIEIEPSTGGTWKWVGLHTLRFEPLGAPDGWQDRLPAATQYTVRVPGDLTPQAQTSDNTASDVLAADGTNPASDGGTAVAASRGLEGGGTEWTFQTPAPSVVESFGVTPTKEDPPLRISTIPVFGLRFDQIVDVAEVASRTTVRVDGVDYALRPAIETEIEADRNVRNAVAAEGPGNVIALAAVQPLPPASDLELVLGSGIPSVEGDRVSPSSQTFFARTRGIPAISEIACSLSDCAAGTDLIVTLNNPLDPSAFDRSELADKITVDPAIAGLEITIDGREVRFTGPTKAGTDYSVRFDGSLIDHYGQSFNRELTTTFSVGDAHPSFDGPRSEMVILDPDASQPALAIETVNHDELDVRVWGVSVRDFATYQDLRTEVIDGQTIDIPESWQPLFDGALPIDSAPNEVVTTEIDLDEELDQVGSQLVVQVSPRPRVSPGDEFYDDNVPVLAWIQRTSLAVDAIADESSLLVWTSDLQTGEPVGGIPVSLIANQRVATTDEEGLAVVKLTDIPIEGLIANDGNTVTYLPAPSPTTWVTSPQIQQSRWQMITNRSIYRPGDTVRVTGWLRRFDPLSERLLETPGEGSIANFVARDPVGRELAAGEVTTSGVGGFTFEFGVPVDTTARQATLSLTIGDSEVERVIPIQADDAGNFAVDVVDLNDTAHLAESSIAINASASYPDGTPVAEADVTWTVGQSRTVFTPQGHSTFEFGDTSSDAPTRSDSTLNEPATQPSVDDNETTDGQLETLNSTTNGAGRHGLSVEVDRLDGQPVTVRATAEVTDATNQRQIGSTEIVVHPADAYVGVRRDARFSELGDVVMIEAIVTDIDGNSLAARPVEIKMERVVSQWENGAWNRTLEPVATCDKVSPTQSTEPIECSFSPNQGGEHVITASVTDQLGRTSTTRITQWVSGALALPTSQVEIEDATIIPDQTEYEPGDTARLLIGAPWAPARGVIVLSRYNIEEYIPFETETGSTIVEVPIGERSIPNVTGWVTITGNAPRLDRLGNVVADERRPAVASGRINLPVAADSRSLVVSALPGDATVRPGSSSTVDVAVTDSSGEPVESASAIVVVSESGVNGDAEGAIQDPQDLFYAPYEGSVEGVSSRQYVQLLNTERVDPAAEAPTAGSAGGGNRSTESGSQTNDDGTQRAGELAAKPSVSVISDAVTTGEDGTATIDFRAPATENDYTVSVIVVADDQRFGSAQSKIAVGEPIEIGLDTPAFARAGDIIDLRVPVANHTDAAVNIEAAVTVVGGEILGQQGASVRLAPQGAADATTRVRLPGEGTVGIRAYAAEEDGETIYAAAGNIDVWPPPTQQTEMVYASLGIPPSEEPPSGALGLEASDPERTSLITHPIDWPTTANVGGGSTPNSTRGRVSVAASTSVMLNAVDTIRADDEPVSTRDMAALVLATLPMLEDLEELAGIGLAAEQATSPARRSLNQLLRDQREDGAWGVTRSASSADPWTTILAVDAALRAEQAGWTGMDDAKRVAAIDYIKEIDQHIPTSYSNRSRDLSRAYAARVLHRVAPDEGARRAADLVEDRGTGLAADAAALVWPLIDTAQQQASIEGIVTSAVGPVTTDANSTRVGFAIDRSPADALIGDSQHRSDGIVLAALAQQTPDSPLIAEVMRGLLSNQRDGSWGSFQADAAVVTALAAIHDAGLDQPNQPNGVARAVEPVELRGWIDEEPVFFDRLTATRPGTVHSITLDDGASLPRSVTLSVDGSANGSVDGSERGGAYVYYRVAATSIPIAQTATTDTVIIGRTYEALDDDEITRDADGTWHIPRGARVAVRVRFATTDWRSGVVLADHLPSGLTATSRSVDSPLDPALRVEGDTLSPTRWFEQQDLNDEGVEVGTRLLPPGSYEYTYTAEATTSGDFVAPPARLTGGPDDVEDGSSASVRVVVD